MIVRDFSPIPYKGGDLSFKDRLAGMIQEGFSWPAEMESQEDVIRYLSRSLDRSYTLLRNITLPDLEITIPMILVGPSGITVIYNTPVHGVFRAQGDNWEVLDRRAGGYKPSKPNLVRRTSLMARAVETFVRNKIDTSISVDGVLVCTNVRTHVESRRPDVRVILIDAIERFAARLLEEPATIPTEKRHKIIRAFASYMESTGEEAEVTEEAPPTKKVAESIDASFEQSLQPLQRTFNFSTRQWIILGGFVLAEIVILLIFLVMIIMTA